MQKLLLILLILFSQFSFGQLKNGTLKGIVFDKFGPVENANILNLTTKKGTFTDHKGNFSFYVTVGDEVQVSSVQHETKTFTVAGITLKNNDFQIQLHTKNYVLDEVVIKKHYLTGSLALDLKKVPKDTMNDLVNNMVNNIKNMSMSAIMNSPVGNDEIHLGKAQISTMPSSYSGITLYSGNVGSGGGKKRKEARKKLTQKELFPIKLLNELGGDFFFNTLKIPKDNYYHFIDYCSYTNIESLFYKKKILTVIEILEQESISYLKTIKQKK